MGQDDEQRRHIRYDPDRNAIVSIFTDTQESELIGLLRDVSKGGCAGLFHQEYFKHQVGDMVYVNTLTVTEEQAYIVWQKSIDKQFVKIGFEFTDEVDV